MSDQLYLTPDAPFTKGAPTGTDDLIGLYGLKELAASVARTDPVTGVKRKLRKSYKNHVADLRGKHVISSRGETPALAQLAHMPPPPPEEVAPLSKDLLAHLRFDKSPQTGIPGFDAKLLATYNGPVDSHPYVSSPRPEKKLRKDAKDGNPEKKRKLG